MLFAVAMHYMARCEEASGLQYFLVLKLGTCFLRNPRLIQSRFLSNKKSHYKVNTECVLSSSRFVQVFIFVRDTSERWCESVQFLIVIGALLAIVATIGGFRNIIVDASRYKFYEFTCSS